MTGEAPDDRLKRMRMRSWRRGMREMDLILGSFADAHLMGMTPQALELFDRLLCENDQELYQWVTGQVAVPEAYMMLIIELRAHAGVMPDRME